MDARRQLGRHEPLHGEGLHREVDVHDRGGVPLRRSEVDQPAVGVLPWVSVAAPDSEVVVSSTAVT